MNEIVKTNKIKKIAVVSGTRSEYGILKPLLLEINKHKDLELKLFITGMHLLKTHGLTINEVKKDGFKIDEIVKMYDNNEVDYRYHGKALGAGIANFTKSFFKMKPDILVVLGDRLEALAAVLAAVSLSIPIAHIHGGDKTNSGHIDESIRHSISKFAHIHFPPTKQSEERLKKMGEEPWRIFRVGALGLDSIINQQIFNKEIMFKKLGLEPKQKTIVLLFHPVILEAKSMGAQIREIIKALKEIGVQTVVFYPNNDEGSKSIIREIKKLKTDSNFKVLKNLSHREYLSLLKHANVLVGNSSSGLIEALALELAVVNVGSRNTGREHGGNVIFTQTKKDKIKKTIEKLLHSKNLKKKIRNERNQFGDGRTAVKIADKLSKIKIDQQLLRKQITY